MSSENDVAGANLKRKSETDLIKESAVDTELTGEVSTLERVKELRLTDIIKENHGAAINALAFCRSSLCPNVVATVADNQVGCCFSIVSIYLLLSLFLRTCMVSFVARSGVYIVQRVPSFLLFPMANDSPPSPCHS